MLINCADTQRRETDRDREGTGETDRAKQMHACTCTQMEHKTGRGVGHCFMPCVVVLVTNLDDKMLWKCKALIILSAVVLPFLCLLHNPSATSVCALPSIRKGNGSAR